MTDLRKQANGRDCLVRLPGICNGDPSTVVLAHLSGGGIGAKRIDLAAALACSACHDVLDGRTPTTINGDLLKLWHLEGVMRTIELWVSEGFVTW